MMPEAAASFAIEEEDVPPDKLEGSSCKRRDISNRTVKNVMNESNSCDDGVRSNENEANSTESAFDSYNTSLTEDGTFGSYSTNLTDEAFGSYEANLASLNEINKELNLEKTVVNVDNATCLNSNTYRRFGCLKVCKSNQTSFGDLTCSDECYIDHDKSIKFDNRESEEITSFDEIQDKWASFARADDEVIKGSLERNENNNLLRKGGRIAFNEGVTSFDTNESPVCRNGKNKFLGVEEEMVNANLQGNNRKGWLRNNDGSDGNETCSDLTNHNDEVGDSTCIGENQADRRYQKNSSEISLNGNETSLENPIDESPSCCKNTNDLRSCDDTSSIHGSPIFYDRMENLEKVPSSTIQIRDVSTETVPNPTYRLRKCTSDPVYKEATPSGYKSRNSFHKDLNEALSSLLWQPYEYQNVRSTDDEDDGSSSSASSSSSCSSGSSSSSSSRRRRDLGSSNNGQEGAEEAGGAVNNLLGPTAAKKRGKSRSRERPLSSRSGLSSAQANSLSVRCAGGARRGRPECDAIFGCEMTETYGGAEGGEGSAGQGSLGNLSRVNIVGLPKEPPHPPRGGGGGALTCAQFKYNANVSSANVVNLGLHQRHHSQIESVQSPPVNHMRSLSVPKKLEGHGEVGEPRRFPINVSNVNVNYYRAVPANVVSSVPQIQCVTSNDCVSNVNIVQAMPVGSNTYNFQNLPNLQQCAVTTFGSSIITQHFPSGNTYNVTSTPIQVQTAPTNASTSTTEVTIHSIPSGNNQQIQIVSRPSEVTRTFTSTEAQTDDTLCPQPAQNPSSSEIQTQTTREQRRRERRERRHHRRSNPSGNVANANPTTNQIPQVQNDRLPDLLNSHLPPSYNNAVTHQNVMGNPLVNANLVSAPLVQTMVPNPIVGSPMVTFPAPVVAGQVPLVQPGPVPVQVAAPSGFRFPFQGTGFRRSRYSEDSPKSCCGLLSMKPGSLRWFIALIAFVAVCCVLVGTVLGAMRTSGRDHLTVSLLMIGVGIVLITVSGIAWKLTSHDSSTCRSMLGLGSTESVDVCARRFVPRLPPSYGRPHHPYAAMMYPEFQYRPPPPSYQASMQEYRLRLLLLDRGHTPQIQAGIQNAVSPPPTYRSYAGSLLRAPLSTRRDAQSEYSCPPSYRSQTSSSRPNNALPPPSVLHSREQSLSLSESNHESINVVLHNAEDDIALDNITLDSLKMEPETELNPLKMLLKGSTSDLDGSKDGNLVTIVQTSDQNPVIVTVSGSSNTDDLNLRPGDLQSEMQILAHL